MRFLVAAAGLAVVLGLGAIAVLPDLRWRGMVVFDKASGRLADIGWLDLLSMLRPGSGVYLERLTETRNPYEVIESPRRSAGDLDAGQQLFREHCGSCHGDNAQGGVGGPSLHDRAFRQGRSDWALYRTITQGIPGTAMVGRSLPRDDVWRLVSYVGLMLASEDRAATAGEASPARPSLEPLTAAELRAAGDRPRDWLTYSGSYDAHRHSSLREINRANIGEIRVAWERQLKTSADRVETSPIVRGSTMFLSEPPNRVLALDATTGHVLWSYAHPLPSRLLLCCGTVNRGVALLGNRVFVGTLDAHLLALDAGSGKLLWDIAVANPSQGYSITGAPLALEDMVVTGVAGGEYGARGFLDAYDAASGKRRWRFYTVPDPGEPGSETWGRAPLPNAGGPTWLTGSYDPELRLIYWGVGNPSPNFYGGDRDGDNLYTNSVVAVDADSGKLRWHFQFTPHDLHDWDSTQVPVLLDAELGNARQRLLALANRNGFYYLLDRTSGEFLLGTPFVRQNWADGLDARGRPRVRPESIPTRQGVIVYPSVGGATNWWSPSYDPALGVIYIPTVERGSIFFASPNQPVDRDGETLGGGYSSVPGEGHVTAVKALDATTGHVRWQFARPARTIAADISGLLSTAGGIVFGGDLETLFALDAASGEQLWDFAAGGQIAAPPITYEAAGRQFIAIAAGHSILAFSLPRK